MRRLVVSIVSLVVAGCGDDSVHHLGDGPPSAAMPGIYITQGNTITVFALDATGDAAPIRTIAGPSTMLSLPIGLGVDRQGLIYAANRTGSVVTAFAKDASGDVAPARLLTAAGMLSPEGLAVDTNDDVFVAACPHCGGSAGGDTAIYHFPAGSTANDFTIQGANTNLTNPGIALDSDRNLVVANSFGGVVETFAPGSTGNATPFRKFTPAGNQNIQGVIAAGGVIILGSPTDGLDLYAADTTGDAALPVATIGPAMLPVQYPAGTFLDASVSPPVLYQNDFAGNTIFIVQTTGSGASLSVGSVRTIQGPSTTLAAPLGIVVIH